MRVSITGSVLIAALAATACQEGPTSPQALSVNTSVATDRSTGDTPNYNLEVILRGDGFGHVKFRQPGNDAAQIVYLDVWVRDLAPNTEYLLQRAVDTNLDGSCTSTTWLTLGKGAALPPQSITTDDKGTGREDLFRILTSPHGTTFDIYFRVVRKDNPTVAVLTSECYQFSVK
ncbi:MAG: hypothetical protein M3P26_01155 [Gemmatimonadota bacterium]|nr:hypothetical protein [Gemmatimonadota bacterium]